MKRKTLLFALLIALVAPLAMNAQNRDVATVNFETGDLSQFHSIGAVTNDATYPWTVTNAKNHGNGGSYCMKSTNEGANSTESSIEIEVDFNQAGSISFYCLASCESATNNWDVGIFYIDGELQRSFLLVTDWVYSTHDVEAGTHTLKWSFTKDGSAAGGDDCFYVDDITFTGFHVPSCLKPMNVAVSDLTAHGATVSWTGTSDSYTLMLGQPTVTSTYDFESGSLPGAFTNDATNPWTVVANTHSGAYCAKSAGGFTSTDADLTLSVTLATGGFVSFSALASSESDYDFGRFLIDGTQLFETSGTTNSWTEYFFPVEAGTHTLTWRYHKDGSGSYGDDCFYVDDIVIKANPATWVERHANTSPYVFTDLNAETFYLVKVKGICGSETSEPSKAVGFTTLISCPAPQGLALTSDAASVTATWDATGGTCNIDINGTVTNNVTSPYTFNAELSTTYTVKIQANCEGNETSVWTEPVSITTPDCIGGNVIEYSLNDSYGDGWNGNAIQIVDECDNIIETLTIPSGYSNSGTLTLCGDYYQLVWVAGSYAGETSFTLTVNGTALYSQQSGSDLTDGQVLHTIGTLSLSRPTGLTASNHGTHDVQLSWTESGTATAWQICLNEDEDNLIDVDSNPYTLTGLEVSTSYTVKVRSVSGTEESCWSDAISFMTKQLPDAVGDGWSDDFEGTSEWYLVNAGNNAWVVGSAVNNGGSKALYISNDGGTNHAYYMGATNIVYATKLMSFETGIYVFEYDWLADGESNYDYLRAWLAPASFEFVADQLPDGSTSTYNYTNSTPEGWISLDNGAKLNQQSEWQEDQSTTSFVTAGDYYIVFMWGNDGSSGTNPPAAIDNFSITRIACPAPERLSLAIDGATVTATWLGDASSYNIDINGTVYANVANPYTFNVELSTTYTVKVQANCADNETSDWTEPVSITTSDCVGGHVIEYTLNDSYGDGWNGNAILVMDCEGVVATLTIEDGNSNSGTLYLCDDYYEFVWVQGLYESETSFTFTEGGTTLFTKPGSLSDGDVLYTIGGAECTRPASLSEDNIGINSAELSWTGSSDSYVIQYRPWTQVGTDQEATEALTPYTYDLSAFNGTGSIAIRHYDVTDMFMLNVDDITVTNAAGTTVYFEDFESGSLPYNISNIDLDGDGYVWGMRSNGTDAHGNDYVNGYYGVSSASWTQSTGPLTPDNWLVISGIELGGSITFLAKGQDPAAVAEKFAVFVSPDSEFTELTSNSTSIELSDLDEDTPYSWRVKGVCGSETSCWSTTNIFKTDINLIIFATDGDWDNLSNWTDAEGNTADALPTVDNKVRIDADAIVPAGVVATAKGATLNGGSITIKDGGQLKQGGSVKVTMEKEITGYGAGNEDAAANYYFIASPFTTTYLYENSTFGYVLNLEDGNYDLYAFDPTQELEWINYKSNPEHSEFTSGDNTGLFNKKGYLYANEEDCTLLFTGTVLMSINNSITDTYEYDPNASYEFNGWKLVGNPYTCNAYLSYVDADNNALEADFYVMNAAGDGYDLLSSNTALAPLTGALVNYGATGKIQYATEVPAKRSGMLNMVVSQGRGTISQARLRFGQGYNLGSMSFRNGSRLYMPVDGNDYAVVFTENQGEMPVSFKAVENGTYSLSFNAEDVTFGYLHLIDNMTGNDVDLLSTPSYTFEAKTTDYYSRFKLVFAAGSSTSSDTFAFYSNGNWVINNEGEATLQVVDVMGRIINNESISGNAIVKVDAAAGVYLLRLVNSENVKVQKVVVR